MPSAVVVFTTLMLLHATLLWMGLSARIPQRFLWSYFVAQGGLVFVIGSVLGLETAVLSLYLALILAAVAILKRARPAAIVAGGYVGSSS
jgi:hypothetical protein